MTPSAKLDVSACTCEMSQEIPDCDQGDWDLAEPFFFSPRVRAQLESVLQGFEGNDAKYVHGYAKLKEGIWPCKL